MRNNPKKLNVLMVIPSFFPLVGGAERQLMGLASKLSNRGVEVDVVTRKLLASKKKEIIDKYTIYRLSTKIPKLSFLFSLFYFILKNRHKYHLIHVHTLNSPAIISTIAGKILNIPVVLKVTRSGKGTQLSRYRNSILGRIVFSFLSTNSFIAITEEVNSELKNFGIDSNKIRHIPNGVNIPLKIAKNNQILKISYIGRLIKRKRIEILLTAISNIKTDNNFLLSIVGEGPEEKYLKELARKLKIKNSCIFKGELPHEEVSQILMQSDIFVLPSDSEGMSNALLEAMASCNAVIVSNIIANKQLIKDKVNGLLFSDLKQLEEALILTLDNADKRLQLASQARLAIEKEYSYQTVTDSYLNLYHDLCLV